MDPVTLIPQMRIEAIEHLRRCCALVALCTGISFVATIPLVELKPATEERSISVKEDRGADPASAICGIIIREAERWSLPHSFFMRLIWQESRFYPFAVSPAGAQGIAQFMPATARERGLKNPYSPAEALGASAHLLSDLRQDFGNLGLAAAAYNAGQGAVRAWLAGRRNLPKETKDYVIKVTGRPAAEWADSKEEYSGRSRDDPGQDCLELASFGGKSRHLASLRPRESAAPDKPQARSSAGERQKHPNVRKGSSEPFCVRLAATGAVCRSVPR